MEPLVTNRSEIWIGIQQFSIDKCYLVNVVYKTLTRYTAVETDFSLDLTLRRQQKDFIFKDMP